MDRGELERGWATTCAGLEEARSLLNPVVSGNSCLGLAGYVIHERRVGRRAHPRSLQLRLRQEHRAEDPRPHHLHHVTLFPSLAPRGVAQRRRRIRLGSGGRPRPRTRQLGLLDARDCLDRGGVGRMIGAGDQQVAPPRRAVVDLRDQLEAGSGIPLAEHRRQQQSDLGIDGPVIPVVTAQAVPGVVRVARLSLLGDEALLLVDSDVAGPRRKGPHCPRGGGPTRRGPPRRTLGIAPGRPPCARRGRALQDRQ